MFIPNDETNVAYECPLSRALNESSAYLADFISDLHYGGYGRSINNCTTMQNDPCYKNVRSEGYFSACVANCRYGPFCACTEARTSEST